MVLQARHHDEVTEMLSEAGLARDSVVVDLEGDLGTAFGIAMRPAAVVVREGIVSEGAVVRNPRQLPPASRNTGVVAARGGARQLRRFYFDLVEVSGVALRAVRKTQRSRQPGDDATSIAGASSEGLPRSGDRRNRAREGGDGAGRCRLLRPRLPDAMPELHGPWVRLRRRLHAVGLVLRRSRTLATGCAVSATPEADAPAAPVAHEVIVTNSHDITAHDRVPEGGSKQP